MTPNNKPKTTEKTFCPKCQCQSERQEGTNNYVCFNPKCPLEYFSLVTRKPMRTPRYD